MAFIKKNNYSLKASVRIN